MEGFDMKTLLVTAIALAACGEPLEVDKTPSCGHEVSEAYKCPAIGGGWDRRFSVCNRGAIAGCVLGDLHDTSATDTYSTLCVASCSEVPR